MFVVAAILISILGKHQLCFVAAKIWLWVLTTNHCECCCRYMDSRAENGLTALHLAVIAGSLPCVQALLAAGADLMLQTIDQGMNSIVSLAAGSSVLHAAVESHSVAIVQAILQVQMPTSLFPSVSRWPLAFLT